MAKLRFGPWNTALEDWPEGWLKLEIGTLTRNSNYIVMTDEEKRLEGLPVTVEEMQNFIRKKLQE